MNTPARSDGGGLVRGLNLGQATTLNIIDMIGVGPFITIPLIVTAMGGPQAMLGWVLGAVFALCDGMIWAELGASMPGAGGSYRYLREIYGAEKLGKFFSFLFIWQLSFSAPLSIASGCIGLAQYASYLVPALRVFHIGSEQRHFVVSGETVVALAALGAALWLGNRKIGDIGKVGKYLAGGVFATIAWVIVAGVTHFDAHKAFDFPQGAWTLDKGFFLGLGAAMLVATYDYWGYYNVCFLGEEVQEPAKNIPRAVVLSIAIVSVIYLVMNISILGVVPWREFSGTSNSPARYFVVSVFMESLYGYWAGTLVTVLIMWTAFASVFSLLLGYSRVPFAAARDGNYFKAFAEVDEKLRIPRFSMLALGGVAAFCCFLRLQDVIAALVIIRIMVQFLVQGVGLLYLRATRPEMERPFRMWLYPVPALLALTGMVFVLISRKDFLKEVRYGTFLVVVGTIVYVWREYRGSRTRLRNAE